MDILVQSAEDIEPYRSFYLRAMDTIRESPRNEPMPQYKPWAVRYFAYDWVTLMNTAAMVQLGGWDNLIGCYTTDCDMYERIRMADMSTNDTYAGPVDDTAESLPDLAALYRQGDTRGSETWKKLQQVGENMTHWKNHGGDRNRWQLQQMGGEGEPYYRDLDGFVEALEIQMQAGIKMFHKKWGGAGCSLEEEGVRLEDEWMVKGVKKKEEEKEEGENE